LLTLVGTFENLTKTNAAKNLLNAKRVIKLLQHHLGVQDWNATTVANS